MIAASLKVWAPKFSQISLFCLLAVWPVLTFSSALMDIFLWTAFGFAVLALLSKQEKPILPDTLSLVFLGLFLLTVVISMTVSDYPKQSFKGFIKVLRHFVVFLTVFHVFRETTAKAKLQIVVLAAFTLLILDGFFQYFFGFDFIRGFVAQDSSAGRRISASFEQYGKLGAYLCTVLPFVWGWTLSIWKNSRPRRHLGIWTILSVAGIILLILTRSRGAFLALTLGLGITLVFRRSWKVLSILILTAALFVAVLPRSMIIHLDRQNREQSLVERFELWYRAWDVIEARPWTGTGINTYAVAHQQFDTRKNWRVQNYYAHNGYLQIAAEIGLPGLLFFLLFLIRWVWIQRPRSFESEPATEVRWGLWGGVVAFMLFCMADTAMHSLLPVITFWFVLGLLGAFNPQLKTSA